MVSKIFSFLGSTHQEGEIMAAVAAVAAVVSSTVTLLLLEIFFQRQIVIELTAGAVKG